MYVTVAYLSVKYIANERIARLPHHDHGHASFGPHQIQPLHSILSAVPHSAMGQDQCVDRGHHLCCLLHHYLDHSVCVVQSVAGRIPSKGFTVSALPQVRRIFDPNWRRRNAGRLVPPYPSNPGCLGLADVHCEEGWCTDRLHDWSPVSFEIPRKQFKTS
jgi:hypothetical protein